MNEASTAPYGAQTMQDLIDSVVAVAEAQVRGGGELTSAAEAAAAAAAAATSGLLCMRPHAWQEHTFGKTNTVPFM
jgi:hypothetical protein